MQPPSDEYLEGYRAGFEDGQAPFKVWTSTPFVIVYIDRNASDSYQWSWRNVECSTEGTKLVEALHEVADDLEDMIEDSKPEDWDDHEDEDEDE